MKDSCIINAAWQYWYPRGTDRLVKSLEDVGFDGDVLYWKDELINTFFDTSYPYTIKLAALHEALKLGYKKILWLDCSVWAIRNPKPIFDVIEKEGGYFWSSGYNMAQCSTDKDLEFAKWSRDYAEKLPELSSSMFGINMNDSRAVKFVEWFSKAKDAGVFGTSRLHNNGSEDERYLHGRQDQTAATIAFYKAGFEKIYPPKIYSMYDTDGIESETTIFKMRGM